MEPIPRFPIPMQEVRRDEGENLLDVSPQVSRSGKEKPIFLLVMMRGWEKFHDQS
jgi:hypothetical protein